MNAEGLEIVGVEDLVSLETITRNNGLGNVGTNRINMVSFTVNEIIFEVTDGYQSHSPSAAYFIHGPGKDDKKNKKSLRFILGPVTGVVCVSLASHLSLLWVFTRKLQSVAVGRAGHFSFTNGLSCVLVCLRGAFL